MHLVKFGTTSLIVVLLSTAAHAQRGQGGRGQGARSEEGCSDSQPLFCDGYDCPRPDEDACMDSWNNRDGETWFEYPQDFDIENFVQIYRCPSIAKRIILSNAVPDHRVLMTRNRARLCETNYALELPLYPTLATPSEIPIRGMIAMATNGVPAFGPQEVMGENAVDPPDDSPIQDAQFWYGHPTQNGVWHFHNSNMGEENIGPEVFLGYALDGFPIYGPLSDDEVEGLDECNGIVKNGSYRYHVRTNDQVDASREYCNDETPEVNNWNYILGCYAGDISNTRVYDWTEEGYLNSLPDDCQLEDVDDLYTIVDGLGTNETVDDFASLDVQKLRH